MSRPSSSPTVSPDQTCLPVYLPCACGCRKPVLQPETREGTAGGRPRKYAADGCRQVALRNRREAEARAAEELRQQVVADRRAAEAEAAREAIRESWEVAEWVAVWRRVNGAHARLTPRQVLDVRAALGAVAMTRGDDLAALALPVVQEERGW